MMGIVFILSLITIIVLISINGDDTAISIVTILMIILLMLTITTYVSRETYKKALIKNPYAKEMLYKVNSKGEFIPMNSVDTLEDQEQ